MCGILFLNLVVGIAFHEIVGHGLTAKLCGGTIESVEVLGVQVFPVIAWIGWPDGFCFGDCYLDGVFDDTRGWLITLGGAASTWVVAMLATGALWLVKRPRWLVALFVLTSVWWIDVFTYTLPVWGLRKAVFFGGNYPEPYIAATGLGCPGWLYQVVVVGSSVAMLACTVLRVRIICHAGGQTKTPLSGRSDAVT